MPVKMGVDPEKLKAPKPQPAGWYTLRLIGFKPKMNKKKDGVNLNGQFEIVSPKTPDCFDKVYPTMSLKMDNHIAAIVHGLGFELETNGDLPGKWTPSPEDPDNVEKWQYSGPLLGKTMEAELAVTKYLQNPERNDIKQVRCKVQGCAQKYPDMRHPVDMIGKSK
jgi:hypothetical protein